MLIKKMNFIVENEVIICIYRDLKTFTKEKPSFPKNS